MQALTEWGCVQRVFWRFCANDRVGGLNYLVRKVSYLVYPFICVLNLPLLIPIGIKRGWESWHIPQKPTDEQVSAARAKLIEEGRQEDTRYSPTFKQLMTPEFARSLEERFDLVKADLELFISVFLEKHGDAPVNSFFYDAPNRCNGLDQHFSKALSDKAMEPSPCVGSTVLLTGSSFEALRENYLAALDRAKGHIKLPKAELDKCEVDLPKFPEERLKKYLGPTATRGDLKVHETWTGQFLHNTVWNLKDLYLVSDKVHDVNAIKAHHAQEQDASKKSRTVADKIEALGLDTICLLELNKPTAELLTQRGYQVIEDFELELSDKGQLKLKKSLVCTRGMDTIWDRDLKPAPIDIGGALASLTGKYVDDKGNVVDAKALKQLADKVSLVPLRLKGTNDYIVPIAGHASGSKKYEIEAIAQATRIVLDKEAERLQQAHGDKWSLSPIWGMDINTDKVEDVETVRAKLEPMGIDMMRAIISSVKKRLRTAQTTSKADGSGEPKSCKPVIAPRDFFMWIWSAKYMVRNVLVNGQQAPDLTQNLPNSEIPSDHLPLSGDVVPNNQYRPGWASLSTPRERPEAKREFELV
jgi:hypothetical protein